MPSTFPQQSPRNPSLPLASRVRFVAVFAFLLFVAPAWSQDYLPLASGNVWTLTNPWVAQPLVLTVTSDQMVGAIRRVRLDFHHPYTRYTYLLNPGADGVKVEGLTYTPTTYRFSEPAMLFWNTTAGQAWKNDFGSISLVTTTATVATPKGTFINCRQYRVIGSDGSPTDWFLAPGVGIVQFGTGPSAFQISSYTLTATAPATPTYVAAPSCPPVGSEADLNAAAVLSANGARFAHVNATWAELEPQPGVFSLGKITTWVAQAKKYNLSLAFTLRVVDTSQLSLPADLAGRALDDAAVLARFGALIRALAVAFDTPVKWVHIGNEVEIYYGLNPAALPAFQTFYRSGAQLLHSIKPGISVSTVFGYPSTRLCDSVFQTLSGLLDHVAFSYYATNGNYAQRAPSVASTDILDMVAMGAGRPVVLTEVGFATSSLANGSEALQQTFYGAALSTIQNSSGQIAGANFFILSDIPADQLASAAAYYGQQGNPQFTGFLGSLGILNQNYTTKAAWSTWQSYALRLAAGTGCQKPR